MLWGALYDCGLDAFADKVKRHKEGSLQEVISLLSQLEREVLNARPWKAIVLCKAAILGKVEESKFTEHVASIQGLLPPGEKNP